jgi:hypothetical protein
MKKRRKKQQKTKNAHMYTRAQLTMQVMMFIHVESLVVETQSGTHTHAAIRC